MSTVITLLRAVVGLFVEDGRLASAILAVVIAALLLAQLLPAAPLVAGLVLLFGCLGVLLANVISAARR